MEEIERLRNDEMKQLLLVANDNMNVDMVLTVMRDLICDHRQAVHVVMARGGEQRTALVRGLRSLGYIVSAHTSNADLPDHGPDDAIVHFSRLVRPPQIMLIAGTWDAKRIISTRRNAKKYARNGAPCFVIDLNDPSSGDIS